MNSFDMDAQCVSMGSQRYDGQGLDQQRLDSQVTMDALAGPRGEQEFSAMQNLRSIIGQGVCYVLCKALKNKRC